MGWPKGKPRHPNAGRKPGVPNKTTTEFKDALNRLLNQSAPHFAEWLDAVGPDRRLELLGKLAEYCHPKLGRTEVTGKDGEPVKVVEIVSYAKDEDS